MYPATIERVAFGQAMIATAQRWVGVTALRHELFSPHCWKNPAQTLPACTEHGLDSRGFDCSGLVIAAAVAAAGADPTAWPSRLRHVRQMTREAQSGQNAVLSWRPREALRPGDLVVMEREWTLQDGSRARVPAHIGILTDLIDDQPIILQVGTQTGEVIHRPTNRATDIIGGVVCKGVPQ